MGSKRLGSRYVSGRSKDSLKFKNPNAPAVKREAQGEWGKASSPRRGFPVKLRRETPQKL
jgi:hypothetical protein